MSAAPGWHGKLPTLGDFASRRLEPGFVECWDHWLAGGLAALRQARPEAWLEAYLASPSWRFLLLPGALPDAPGQSAWAGVLMPSVDRGGRYFPFSIVQRLGAQALPATAVEPLLGWLHEVDDLAADALHDDWPIERLEHELARTPAPAALAAPAPPALWASSNSPSGAPLGLPTPPQRVTGSAELMARLAQDAAAAWWQAARGSAWWFAGADGADGRVISTRGLPAGAAFEQLLGRSTTAAQPS